MVAKGTIPPYPGYDHDQSYKPDSPVPRVRLDGLINFNKNRSSLDDWVFKNYGEEWESPRPVPRCPSDTCKQNYEFGRNGTVANLLRSATPRPTSAPPRVKPEAEETAAIGRGKRMNIILTKYAENGPECGMPRVKPEAKATAEHGQGGNMRKILHSPHNIELIRAEPRVKPEAKQIANISEGIRMNTILHRAKAPGSSRGSARAVPRVKPAAAGQAEQGKGGRMERLIHSYGQTLSSRPAPRVKPEAEDYATLDKGLRIARIIHSARKLPASGRQPLRVNTTDAKNIAHKGHVGSMGQILRDSNKKTVVHVPGHQRKMYVNTALA